MGTKIGTNNEIPTGPGKIEHVRELIAKWFPEVSFEVLATGGPGHIGPDGNEQTGYLRFNLIAHFGTGLLSSRTSYMVSLSYRDFTEGDIGRHLGAIDLAHEMRNVCKQWIQIADAEIASFGNEQSVARIESTTRRDTWRQALNAVPMFGWNLVKAQ